MSPTAFPSDPPRTVTDRCEKPGPTSTVRQYLSLMFQAHAPLAEPRSFTLDGIDEIAIGRGPTLDLASYSAESASRANLTLPDPWVSHAHAEIQRDGTVWVLVDRYAKNRTLVNGVPQYRIRLADGDVIQCGRSFLLYREIAPSPRAFETRTKPVGAPAVFATLRADLAQRFERLALVARSSSSIILLGQTGTGKEEVARAIHELSGRKGAYVAVNCGALPEGLVEGELFGHRAGAYTGASSHYPGLVRAAEGGTLFLDEIDDLPVHAQAALLRVLQEDEVQALGTSKPVKVDVRVLAASQRDLPALVERSVFRRDLFARLSGFTFELPPVAARREDLGILVRALLLRLAGSRAARIQFSTPAAEALALHAWPLNVRELEKCLEAALALAEGDEITSSELPDTVRKAVKRYSGPLDPESEAARDELIKLLRKHRGNLSAIAREWNRPRRTIQRLMRRFRLDRAAHLRGLDEPS